MGKKLIAAAAIIPALWPLTQARAQEASALPIEEVGAGSNEEIVVQARNRITNVDAIAGNASVISADQVENGRAANIGDALRFQPGLLAQTATGGEATRFSMRGSGIIRSPFAWGTGIQMLIDGLPMTTAEGSPYEYYEALANNSIEVYRGANAFDYSPTTQGGAINYVPHTGYDSAPLLLRAEAGSYGYNRQQISSGGVQGDFDYYVSGSRFAMDGFRRHSNSRSLRLVADAGYKITPDLKARFYFIYADQDTKMTSALTQAQIQADPHANSTTTGNRKNPHSLLLGTTVNWSLGGASSLKLGVAYKRYKVRNLNIAVPDYWNIEDIAASLRYDREDTLFGLPSKTEVAVLFTALLPGSHNRKFSTDLATLRERVSFKGIDATFLFKNDLELADRFWLTTGLAAIEQTRVSHITLPTRDFMDQEYFNLAPRIGARFEVGGGIQLFANYSRSVEAPISHALPQLTGGLYTYNADIREQVQDTAEAGARGKLGGLNWSIALYRTWVKDELLNVQVSPAVGATPAVIIATNAKSPTIHQGIELAAEGTLWKSGGFALSTQQSLTINDFHYRDEPDFGTADLPGVPRGLYQGALRVDHDSGLFVGAGTEILLNRYAADFANTIWVKPYAILDLRAGWTSKDKGWQLFVDGKNVTGKKYTAFVSPVYNARGIDSAAYFPGMGANITFGITKAF